MASETQEKVSPDIAFSEYLEIRNIAFEWAHSYDTKDWQRLRRILAPLTRLDFRSLHGELHEGLSPDDYVAILSSPKLIGGLRLKTQHLLGGSSWERLGDGRIKVEHQLRVAHQLYADDGLTAVKNKGHAHGLARHWYVRGEDGAWRLEGVQPELVWSEYDLFGTLNPEESPEEGVEEGGGRA